MGYFYNRSFPALWLLWLAYWSLAARNTKPTRRRESAQSRLSYSVLFCVAILAVSWPEPHGTKDILFQQIWPQSHFTFWLGIALTLAGFAVTVWARLTLGRNWSATVTLKEHHELVQTGPYAWVRHPIYTGLLLAFLGTAVAMAEWRGVLALVLILVSFVIKLRIEERWMIEVFGPVYLEYRQRVGPLVPFI
jgi:protein-S-isoprenylcysteine O-methyltransferase Ste14